MKNHCKRRKYKDNPYNLEQINDKYIIKFKDNKNYDHVIEVREEIYNTFNQFELYDLKEMNYYDRHIEHSEIYEDKLYHRSFNKKDSIEDIVIKKLILNTIYDCIDSLSNIQKRRIKYYYFNELSLETIALLENTSHQAISKSINLGIVKIQKMLKIKI